MQIHIKGSWNWFRRALLGDVKNIKFGKRSPISSDVSEEQSNVYTSTYIESDIIERYNSDKQLNSNLLSHTWNEEYDAFDQQLEKWGLEKSFSYQSEPVKRDLRTYIEDW